MRIIKVNFSETLKFINKIYIDVRTSQEYSEDHIPNAINLPLLNEEERKTIGILYKTQGGNVARLKGVKLITPKLENLINSLINITYNFENVIFYCSRGGLRSYSMASFFSMVSDKNIFTIERGYKGFRKYVLDFFEHLSSNIKGKFLVIDGLTGSGKTIILNQLKNEGYPVIDLENLAAHRGSAFGKIGIKNETNQKRFESQLWKQLYTLKNEKLIIIEGESKKIGKINLPEGFYNLMNSSPHIWIEPPFELRIKVLLNDYLKEKPDDNEIKEALIKIKDFIGKKNLQKMFTFLEKKDYKSLIKVLLENYYDKLYHKKRLKDHEFYKKINYKTINEGVNKVREVYDEIIRI